MRDLMIANIIYTAQLNPYTITHVICLYSYRDTAIAANESGHGLARCRPTTYCNRISVSRSDCYSSLTIQELFYKLFLDRFYKPDQRYHTPSTYCCSKDISYMYRTHAMGAIHVDLVFGWFITLSRDLCYSKLDGPKYHKCCS